MKTYHFQNQDAGLDTHKPPAGLSKCKFDSEQWSRVWKSAFLTIPGRLPDSRLDQREGLGKPQEAEETGARHES